MTKNEMDAISRSIHAPHFNRPRNHIENLTRQRDEARETLEGALEMVHDLMLYLHSSKFAGTENDYIYVSTDLLPKVCDIRRKLRG